jgi:hypothetical protein
MLAPMIELELYVGLVLKVAITVPFTLSKKKIISLVHSRYTELSPQRKKGVFK